MVFLDKNTTFFLCANTLHKHILLLQSKTRGKGNEQKRQKHEKTATFYQSGEPQND